MLYSLSVFHKRKIAFFLSLLFYSQILLAGGSGIYRSGRVTSNSHTRAFPDYVHTLALPEKHQDKVHHPHRDVQNSIRPSASNVLEGSVDVNDLEEDAPDPGQPEMQSFKSIGTDNMVDLFTGDFSYNIPLLDVGGYPVNIFYNSGVSMDQEASWVGLGWNINPGTISRNMRGLPDDFNGKDKVTKSMHIKDDITVGASVGARLEIVGFPLGSLSVSQGIFYNNYKGLGLEASFGLSVSDKSNDEKTAGVSPSAGLNINLNSQQGATIRPSLSLSLYDKDKVNKGGLSASVGYNSRVGLQNLQMSGELKKYDKAGKNAPMSVGLFNGSISFASPAVTPSIRMPLSRVNYSLGVSIGAEVFLGNPAGNINGYYSKGSISSKDAVQTKPAYGYLYMADGQKDDEALMDFNRINDGVYTKNNPVISMPSYTYDVYSMSGEGTGGSFRPYRGDIGYVKDGYTKTRDDSYSINAELGSGNAFEVGVNMHAVLTPTEVGEWKTGNLASNALKFHDNNDLYQAVYFKNPAEKTRGNDAFTEAQGGSDLMRIKLSGQDGPYPITVPVLERFSDNKMFKEATPLTAATSIRQQRDKRSQVISYLNAEDAARIGLSRTIVSYSMNQFPIGSCTRDVGVNNYDRVDKTTRASHHLSEITVLNSDGRRYVYGLPVYNLAQQDVTFATDNNSPNDDQTASYTSTENSLSNKSGKDNYYQKEAIPAYAHSFLLTGLLSPDYVDLKDDGITDDDFGDAVKFNYTKIEKENGFNWRVPLTTALNTGSFNEGMKTDRKDNKITYSYGQRELWYLNSIESKNMMATFVIEDREDAREAVSENGGVNGEGMMRLKRIDLYSKADRVKFGGAAKPIKSVFFDYSYELCQNTPSNKSSVMGQKGKLTLKKIWFTYNGNDKDIKNKYQFNYSATNPNYNRSHNDRWGTYKPTKTAANVDVNLGGMNNADYPYATQNKALADQYASAWVMDQVILPSGGKIKMTYESDDYAYVQDRRAAQMFRIAGFGADKNATLRPNLYSNTGLSSSDYLCVFIDNNTTTNTTASLKRCFEGVKQLYMKLRVSVPKDVYGEGSETIPVYAEISEKAGGGPDVGIVPGNPSLLYAMIKPVDSKSPMASACIQFLRDYLPSKAFKGSDVALESGVKQVFMALKGLLTAATGAFSDFASTARRGGYCNNVDVQRSFIRLNNPGFDKLGGGLRVSKVEISDSWDLMTLRGESRGMEAATYGQEYDYSTMQNVDGQAKKISSGVATFEPGIGAEENPFREILRYNDKQPLGPTQYGAVELPVGEMFYPSPMVGYSNVTVRSINRQSSTSKIKSGVGKQVSEFYTSKDFPVISDFTDFDPSSRASYRSNPILQILHLDMRQTTTLSQGFRVQLNDMNGKMKSQASYGEDETKLVTYTQNYYRLIKKSSDTYRLNNKVLATAGPSGDVVETQLGKEVETMVDFRQHTTKTIAANLDFNINGSLFGLPFITAPSLVPPVYFEENNFRSASVMKIVNEYGILDSVVSIDKGSQVTTKDLVYDGETGNVLLTRTNNEFNDPVYNFNYPAHWAYTGMHPAYRNIDLTYSGVKFRHGLILESPQVNMDLFESGDEIYVTDKGESVLAETEACASSNCTPSTIVKSFDKRIWAVDAARDAANTQRQMIFLSRDGSPYNADDVTLRVVRSGKRNMLDASVGSVTSRLSPLVTVSGQLKIDPKSADMAIATSATTYKDHWRVDNAFYRFDTTISVPNYARIKCMRYNVDSSAQVDMKVDGGKVVEKIAVKYDPNHLLVRAESGKTSYSKLVDSWIKFDFRHNLLPVGAIIFKAELSLYSHVENNWNASAGQSYSHTTNPFINHQSNWSHQVFRKNKSMLDNRIAIFRMTSPWPTTDATWVTTFADGGRSLHDWRYIANIPATAINATSSKNYILYGTDNSRIPIAPGVINSMMVDARNYSSNRYASGFRIMQERFSPGSEKVNQNEIASQCFMSNNQGGLSPYAPGSTNPFLNVYYYVCGDITSNLPCITYALAKSGGEGTGGGGDSSLLTTDPYVNQLVYCGQVQQQITECRSIFSKKRMNPYVMGVLGCWRPEKSYVYYGDRTEKTVNPSPVANKPTIDARTAGSIKDFAPYWTMHDPLLQKGPNTNNVWVWNSETTQFNKRGFETENHDPIGRFNSGLYGYSQALPVAVANNSRHREIAFDGFEDYDYKATPCGEFCKERRHLNVLEAEHYIANDTAHTGKHSLRVGNNSEIKIVAPITLSTDNVPYSLQIKMDATTKSIYPAGSGFNGNYYNFLNSASSCDNAALQAEQTLAGGVASTLNGVSLDFAKCAPATSNCNTISKPGGINNDQFTVRWEGWVRPPVIGDYVFAVRSDDGFRVKVDGVIVLQAWKCYLGDGVITKSAPINFGSAGVPHKVTVEYYEYTGVSFFELFWKTPCSISFDPVPKNLVYPTSNPLTATSTLTCLQPADIQVRGNALNDTFNIIRGSKMVFSTWVYENQDCPTGTYVDNEIDLYFKTTSNPTATLNSTLHPKGAIIEGWQRYEDEIIIPTDATSIELHMKNIGGFSKRVYFDDIRFHPFNGNMKSFVYHPSNLRLMAELDENNYASMYEYDDDGTLVRVKKETIKGVKTIKETRSSLQKVIQ